MFNPGGGVAGPVRFNEEAFEVPVSRVPGPDQGDVRDCPVTDPALGAIEYPLAAVPPGSCFEPAGDV